MITKNLITIYTQAWRWIWFTLLIVSIMGMCDIPNANIFSSTLPIWIKWVGISLAAAFKAGGLVLLLALFHRNFLLRIISIGIAVFYVALCIINFFGYSFYEIGISHKMIMLMAETTPEESREFISTFASKLADAIKPLSVILTVLVIAAYIMIRKMSVRCFKWTFLFTTAAGAISLILLMIDANIGKNAFSVYGRTVKNIIEVKQEYRQVKSLMSKLLPYHNKDKVKSERKAYNLIVVYGESADRDHMSLYGYGLPTTPHMDAMADSLYIFTDALASAKFTATNMERILTMKSDDQTDGWWNYPILIDIMKAAGYKTYWFSNQEQTGMWGNATAAISSRADIIEFIGKTSSEDHLLQKYDEVLIPRLEQALADTSSAKWIGIHLMGSHFAYRNRYPENRQKFNGDDIRCHYPRDWMDKKKYSIAADYDNSIRYTDSIVGNMFDMVARQTKPSVIIYLSDHGENVYSDSDYIGRDIKHVRVPLVIYANAAYRSNHPSSAEAIEKAQQRKITTADLPYAIMAISGTQAPEYDYAMDFLSDKYETGIRYVEDEPWPYDR